MPVNDNMKWVYDQLTQSGANMGTIDDFEKAMSDENNRKWAYDYANSKGMNLGSMDDFTKAIMPAVPTTQQETYPQEVVDRFNSPDNKPGSFKDMATINREYQQLQKAKADVQAEEAAKAGQFGNGNMVSTPNGMMPDLRGAGRRVRAQQPATQQPVQQEQVQPQQPQVEYPFEAQQNVGDQMWNIAHMHDNENQEKPRFDYRHAENGFVNPATQKSDDRQTFTEGLKRAKEDDEILKQVTLKPEETADDVYENAMMRFSNTEEGIAMQDEADEAMRQHLATLQDEFTHSKEYKDIVSQKPTTDEEAEQMTERLNQAFQEKYGAEMEKFMQPYQEKMMEAVQNRYGESISEGMRKVNAKAAGQQVTDLQSQVNELQAKRGQTGSGTLRAANHLLEETQEVIDAANRGDTGFLKELGQGFWDNLDARNFTWGISDALDSTNLKIALEAAEKGEQLSKEQEALLDAHAVNMIVSAYFGSDLSRGYKAGQMTAESLPFMLDIITNPISASGNAVAKGLLKYGMKRFGAKAVNRAVPRFLGRVAGESVAAAGMTSTTGLPRVLGETMDRLNANFNVTIGDDGKPQVQRVDNKSTMEALSEAVRSNFFEYQSESVFNALRGFNPLKGMMSRVMPEPVNKIIGAVKSSGVGRVYKNTFGNKTMKEIAQRAQFHGLPEEYMEEVYNNFANVATGDMSLKDATDLDKNIDTFLGLAPTSVLFGAIGVGGYAYERYQNRKNMNRVFGQMNDQQREQLAQLQEMAAGNQKEAINREVKRFLQETIAADNLTQEEKRAEIEYLFEFVKQNAIGEIDAERTPEERAIDDAEESRMAGYDTTEPEAMNEAKNDYEAALADIEGSFSPETIAAIDANPTEELRLTYMNPSYSDEDRQRVLDYVNAKQRYDGMVQRVRDDIDGMIQTSNAEIDSQVNTGTGMVQPATLKVDNRQVHIIDGNVALLEDGSIDTANSTQDIIVRDAQTGKVEFVSPSAFLGVDEAMDPAALKQQAAENIRQTKAQQAADQIDGVLPFQQGDTYDGVDAEGQPVQVQIISDNGDGTVNVGINGEAAGVPMQKEAVQQLVDNARRAQAVARREDAASQRAKNTNLSEPSRNMTEGRDAYSLNEEIGVTLPDGSIGSAVINAEQNADGQYEVELRDEAGNPVGVQLLTADQLNAMQPAEAQAEAGQQSAPTNEAVSSDLNGEQEQPAEQATETPSAEVAPEVVPQNDTTDAMPMIGEGEDMEPDFVHATPQRTQQYLYEESGLEQDEADDFVKDMKKRAQTEKTKLEGKKPKLSDRGIDNKIPRFQRAKAAWQQQVDDAQRKVDYWNSVEQEQQMKQRQAREAAEAERLAAMTDEERLAQQRLTEQDAQNLEEIAAQMIGSGSIKLNRDSYKQETGYSESEAKKMFRIFATDGMSVSRAGEQIEQAAREAGIPFDETDANAGRNAVISVLQSAETWGDLLHYIEKNRQAEADALLRAAEREQEELLDRLAVAYNFASGEDYRAYEEFYLPMYLSELDAATGEEYYAAIADDINHLNEIENGERTDNSEGEGSSVVLPEEQPSVGNRESTVEGQVESEGSAGEVPSEERPASEEAPRGEVEIAPSEQLKPTDLRDSVKPDESKLKPIGRGAFGNIYDQFKGKVKEALDFLLKHKSGDLLGVFHRDGFGDIDLVWGSKDEEKGLDHIIDKHVNKLKDFASAEEAISVIDDVINNGRIIKDKWDKATFEKDDYRVVVSKNTRDDNGQIVDNDKRWVVTAFDNSKTEKEKATSATTRVTPDSTSGSRAVAPDVASSESKDNTSSDNIQENQQENEWGDKWDYTQDELDSLKIGDKVVFNGKPTKISNIVYFEGRAYRFNVDGYTGTVYPWEISPVRDKENQQENEIQGLRGYSEKDVADLVRTHIEEQMEGEDFEIVDIKVIGSRTRGEARPDSDLDVLVEYKGRMKEDTAFNILNDEDSRLTIEDIPVDINPITAGKSGTIEQWMKRNADYKKDIETARKEVAQNPTEAQKEAGNYKKGHIKLDGYDISIENPKGSTRSGVDEQGKEWSVTMNNDYGYLRGTEGVDGDHIDVFLNDNPTEGNVFVVDQVKPDGSFDEHKVMYGFATADEARAAYLANYSPGWTGLGAITEVNKDEFKKWVESSHRKTKPFAEYKSVKPISGQNEASVVRGEGYTITPAIYKKKSGGMLDMQLVKFDTLTPEQKKTLSGLARQMKGWWSREDEGFLMRSMEDAESLTNAVQAPTQEVTPAEEQKQEDRVEVEKPQQRLSQYYSEMEEDVYEKRLTRLREQYKNSLPSNEELENKIQQFSKEVKQYEEEVDNASEQEKPFAQGRLASASGSLRAFRTFKNEIRKKKTEQERDAVLKEKGLKIGDKVTYKGKEAILYDIDNGRPVLDTGMSPVIYELVEWEDVTIPAQANQSGNKIVTDARYEELKERMRKKLGGQMNLGIDPEILTIGIEMAVYHIEKGSRKFADYAKAMIADLGDAIRPYLKAFYNGARDLPEVEQAGWNTEMESADNVSRFDVANFDKPSIDAMATAKEVTKEQEVKQQAEEAVSQVTSIAEQPKLRPATEEDLEGNPAVYYKGRRYRIVMLMRQGSQVSATEFEKPKITSVVLTNMESVSPSELMVEDTPASTPVDEQPKNDEAKPKESKKKPVKKAEKAQPMSLDLFAQFDAENEPVNNEENNRNNEENSVTSQSEVSGDELAARRWFRTRVFDALLESLQTGEKPFRNITELRSLAIKQGMKVDLDGRTDILLQELVEDALVRAARRVVESGRYGTGKQTFDAIVQLYDMQPTIAQRSSNRIKMQQYSTPIPMAYVADMFVRRASNQLGLEPTAGNGMLVFALPAGTIHANELDETRLSNLREQGFSAVTQQDATQPFDITDYDFVVANPPFGSAAAKDYDGKMIGGLEEQIALNALASMKDDGRAAIIIGGNMEYAKNGSVAGNKAFWTYLYDHYNVKGVVDMEGKLFQKQGTTFPTRMILIDGRRSAEERAQTTVYPPVKDAAVPKVSTFDDLYDTVEIIRKSKDKTNGTEILRTRERELVSGDNNTSGSTERSGRGEQHRPDDTQLGRSEQERSSTESQRPVSRTDRADNGAGTTGSTTEGNQPRDSRGIPAADTRRVDGVGVPQNRVGLTQQQPKKQEKRNLDTEKLSYRPHNSAFSLQSVAPASMVEAMDKVLSDIEKKYGAIDEFVRSELDYTTIEEAHQALAAEQMDSVAMAIYQMKQGQAMIIGDQTGVGKGRQMAALIRWAVKRGEKPIFITQKADLFSDIYRDLVDVGSGDLNPFIFNSDGAMVDAKGNTVHKPLSSAEMKKVFDSGELPDEYDFAVLTYSQVNTGDHQSQEEAKEAAKKNGQRTKKSAAEKNAKATPKATFLRKIAKDNYLLLDESHTAAGQSNTGAYLQSLLRDAKAATFASATFAKRPDTMPMYAIRTAMSAAKVKPEDMIKIIEKGGVTLQEIMSRALTEAGQMVRRERDMSDVKTDWKTINDEATVKRARENYDKTIAAFNRIIKFQEDYVKPRIEELNAALAITAESAGIKKGTDKMGVANVPFASKTYNYTKQLMLALKVDAIIDEVEAEIKAGRHPVIALESTMESSIKEYAPGEIISEPTFSASLLKGLDSVMQYTVTDQDGNERHEHYTPKSLGEAGEKAYYELQDFIRESTKDIYISPLDAIITGLNAKGYKVGELTGRSSYLEVNEDGKSVVRRRTDKDKKKMQREFNNGTLDVLILNKSASTGISLHASEKFTDQRQRSMIIAQPLSDINDYMQMIGRIDRTGQVHRGYYINLGLPVPAENRFLMMLSTKLKSLNANTTTSQDSENNDVEAPDLLNKYGSRVVVEYLRDNPDIYIKMGEPLKSGGMGGKKTDASQLDEYIAQEDDARRITGYVALLSTDEQDAFYDEVVRRYNDLMRYLNDTGNNDLKITVMPLKAKTLEKRLSSEGKDTSGANPFAGNAYVEKVEMDVLRKPMKAAEIRKTIEQLNPDVEAPEVKAKTAAQEKMLNGKLTSRVKQIIQTVEEESNAKFENEEMRYEQAKAKAEETIAKQSEKINAQKKRTTEEKQNAIAKFREETYQKIEDTHRTNVERLRNTQNLFKNRLKLFEVGKNYLVPDNLETPIFGLTSNGIFCGYKAKDSKISMSTTFAVFATLDGRRRIEVKLSDGGQIENISKTTDDNWDAARSTSLDNWDSQIPSNTRKEGYIMTGNILQAVADTQDERGNYPGKLISYTDEDGNVHDGILMPDSWNVGMLKTGGVPINARLKDIRDWESVESKDGDLSIQREHGYGGAELYTLTVPRTRKDGGKYFENDDILSLVQGRNFYPYRGKLRADVWGDNIEQLVNELANMGVQVKGESSNTAVASFQVSEDTIQRRSQAQKVATNAVLQALQNARVPVQTVSDKEALQMLLLSMNGTDWKRVRDAAEASRRYGQQRYYVVNLEDPTHINEAFYYETKDAAQKDAAYYNRLGWGSFVMLDLDSEKNVVSELENPERIAAQVEFLKVKGKVYGWTDGKTIYLTKRGMNPNTTIHEYTHLWAASLQRTNPELWGQVKDLLRGTPVWADVTEDTNYRNIWNNEDAIVSEALSRISGRENGNYLTKLSERAVRENGALDAASIIDRVRRALEFFWNWVGTHVFGMKEFRNIGQVTDRILYDLMSGEQLTFEQGEEMAFNVAPESYQPTKTGKGYKVFVLKDGQLYPPMVANPNGAATPVGVWLEAHAAPVAGTSKTGRPQVKAGGKGTQGGSGTLAYRPGWHLGEIPYAKQFNRKDESGERQLFPSNFVWAEVEYANDVDYQEEARKEGTNENGKYQHSLAGLKRVPENGSYRYRTNPDPTTDEWIITGAMKVNRILTPSEVDAMVRAAGREPQKRQEGAVTDEQVNELNEQLGLAGSGVRFREIYRRNSEVAYNFARKNKGVGRVAVITAENGYDILRQRGLSADKAREYMEEFKKGESLGLYFYGIDLIVVFDNGKVSENEIISYLWHEAGHRVIHYYNIPREWINEIAEYTKVDSPEFYEDIQRRYSDHSEDARNEEYTTFMIQGVYQFSDKELTAGLEEMYNSGIPAEQYIAEIVNVIRYGTEERNNEILQEASSIGERQKANEVRNGEANGRGSQAEEAIEQEVNRLADKLGVPVTIVHSVSELPQSESEARKRIDEGRMVKGWYNNGRIFVYVPNTEDAADAKRTMAHEIVAHYGLRKLLGKRFNDFMLEVYEHADLPIRQQIERLAARYDWDFVTATEEYLASLAETTNFDEVKRSGWWARIKQAFYRILEDMGFGRLNGKLTDNELRYLLWRSYDNLQRERENRQRDIFDEAADTAMQYELGLGDYMEPTETSRFRITMRDKATVRTEYEKMVQSGTFQFREAVQDSMRGLHALYKAVLGNGFTTIENVPGYENAYLAENRMSSQSAAEQHDYFNRYMQPLLKAIGKIAGRDAAKREELTDYMMAKHGLERNVVLAERDARIAQQGGGDYDQALQKNRERDYAGLTALTGESDLGAAELMAQQMVDDYENTHDAADIQALWDAVKDASHATLEKLYKSGLMSGDTYQNTLAMFQNYIPLRGWEETTSDEVYGYLAGNDSPLMGSVLKTAKGRSSKADDPIAYIAQMADKAIMEGNRNRMKQTFMNFVLNHPSDLVSVSDIWMQHDDLRGEWVAVFPELEPDDTAEEVERKLLDFENDMQQLSIADPDHFKRSREHPEIPYRVKKGNLREHQVLVKRNGKTSVLTINGNPRAAQALNGLTNPDVDVKGAVGNLLKMGEYVNRQLSAFYTTRNPDFVVSNFLRDMVYSNVMTWVKENPKYALRFHRNVGRVNPAMMRKLLGKWESGTLNDSNYTERMFRQFMLNGGETGYTSVRDLEKHKQDIAKELKKQGSVGRKAWEALGMQMDLLNRSVENCARFAAFVTSREMGRSIERSIYDAKEVSVNFNKKGSGGKMVNTVGETRLGKLGSYVSGLGRVGFVFWNAGVQGMTNFGRVGKRHQKKFIAAAASVFTLGVVVPLLAQLLSDGDDDDKNAYYNLAEYIRRSNIVFYAGDQWVTIPLPIELRALYGLGELATGVITGAERYSDQELAFQIASQVSQILPLDMLEGGGGLTPFIPSAVKPAVEAYLLNRRWTGLPVFKDSPYNKTDPEWKKAYASTDKTLVAMTRWLNELGGGDDFKKSEWPFMDINPAKLEYLLSGTFGGYVSVAEKLKKMGETAVGERDFEWRNMLIGNRVMTSGDETTEYRKLQNEFYRYKEEADETKRLYNRYQKVQEEGDEADAQKYAEKQEQLLGSDEYRRYEIFEMYKDEINSYDEMMAEAADKDDEAMYKQMKFDVIKEMVEEMRKGE